MQVLGETFSLAEGRLPNPLVYIVSPLITNRPQKHPHTS